MSLYACRKRQERQQRQTTSNKSEPTKETQNEEIHRFEINSEMTLIDGINSPVVSDVVDDVDVFIRHKETLSENYNLPSPSFYYLYLLLKNNLFNFFKILKRRSVNLVLPSYVVERKKPVSTSLSILKGVKPVVFLLRNKLLRCFYFFLYVVLSAPTLFICLLSRCRLAVFIQIRTD